MEKLTLREWAENMQEKHPGTVVVSCVELQVYDTPPGTQRFNVYNDIPAGEDGHVDECYDIQWDQGTGEIISGPTHQPWADR